MHTATESHAMMIMTGRPPKRAQQEPIVTHCAMILYECSARACSIDIESVDVALEVHHKPASLDNQNPNDEALPAVAIINQG